VPLGFVALGAGALLIVSGRDPRPLLTVLAMLATATSYIMLESRASSRAQIVVGALVLPLAFLLCAILAVELDQRSGALLAMGWAVAAAALWRVSRGRRDLHLATAAFGVLTAIVLALHHRPVECVVALAAGVVGIAYLARHADAKPVLLPLSVAMIVAAIWSHALLADRTAYAYAPFLTQESLAAAAVVAAAFAAWRLTRDMPDRTGQGGVLIFVAVLFLWGRAELERAISPEVGMFSLILYYAASGISAIAVGRRRPVMELRVAGMALALYAAAKAVMQASGLTTIGFRVGSYLLVGGFLLAVAYWYRAATADSAAQPAARP
jgi:hypothetical protein